MSISPASKAQRDKVRHAKSIYSARPGCDPAHIWPRSRGGCDHPDCVIPLTRDEHNEFDAHRLDILSCLVARKCWAEMAHPIIAHGVSPLQLLERLTGQEWRPA
jgi:hypothetical protein